MANNETGPIKNQSERRERMLRQMQWILYLCVAGALLFGMTVAPGFAADGLFSDAGDAQVSVPQVGRASRIARL
jgi:hypothetical protein